MKRRSCELCNADAAVFCPSDAAFLCRTCDSKVHEANFLVARHVRRSICSDCNDLTGDGVSGVGFPPLRTKCPSCAPISDEIASAVSDNSSDCVSSTTTSPENQLSGGRRESVRRRTDHPKAEGVFAEWCGKLGVGDGADVAVRAACKGLKACAESWTVLPFRVCLAASMWLGLRLSGDKSVSTWQVLKRLEEVSGVPARVIVAAEMKLERGLRVGRKRLQRRRLELEEGWAEC